MTMPSIRPAAEAFYDASARRDVAAVAAMLDQNVDWLVQGPVDLFPFLGQRRGRTSVIEGFREIAEQLSVTGYQVETLVVEGDRAAAMIRITSIVRATGKVMTVRTTQFSRFVDGKVVEMRGVLDSFDMVEQTIGRPLDVAIEAMTSAA